MVTSLDALVFVNNATQVIERYLENSRYLDYSVDAREVPVMLYVDNGVVGDMSHMS
jgi:hypothetical protein